MQGKAWNNYIIIVLQIQKFTIQLLLLLIFTIPYIVQYTIILQPIQYLS